MRYKGFDPIYDENSRVLILGSFPSVKSRETAFYYGNPRNRFWTVLSATFGEPLPRTVEDKKRLCLSHGVALWDIVESCEIEGSLDANIRDYRTADLSQVLKKAPIEKILCNGQTSYRITKAAYRGEKEVVCLPSTSPANVRFDEALWTNALLKK